MLRIGLVCASNCLPTCTLCVCSVRLISLSLFVGTSPAVPTACRAYVHSDDGFWRWLLKHIELTALDEQLFDLILHETGQAEWLRGEVLDAYLMQFIEAYKLADMSEVYQEYA